MKEYKQEERAEIITRVWNCLTPPLEKHGLPWADNTDFDNLAIDPYPVEVNVDVFGKASVQIHMETLAKEPDVAWAALQDMEAAIEEKFGDTTKRFLYDYRYICFRAASSSEDK